MGTQNGVRYSTSLPEVFTFGCVLMGEPEGENDENVVRNIL